jgi:hypothetical protein
MDLSNDQRFSVLMAELEERYGSAHKIRERTTQFIVWISGLAIGLAWLLISDGIPSISQRWSLTFLVLALYLGASHLLRGLHRGAHSNREAMIRVERALGLFDKGLYLPEQSVLPDVYTNTKPTWSHDSRTLPGWVTLVAVILIALIWSAPAKKSADPNEKQSVPAAKEISRG